MNSYNNIITNYLQRTRLDYNTQSFNFLKLRIIHEKNRTCF